MDSNADNPERAQSGAGAAAVASVETRPRAIGTPQVIEALSAITEEEISSWPAHCNAAQCWCRPKTISSADGKTLWVLHRGPEQGYFNS